VGWIIFPYLFFSVSVFEFICFQINFEVTNILVELNGCILLYFLRQTHPLNYRPLQNAVVSSLN
jgi:hypothetical protein